MYKLAFLWKRKEINVFFIVAFTFAILTFSIGSSIVKNQNSKLDMFSRDKNKVIKLKLVENYSFDEIQQVLKDKKINLEVNFYDDDKQVYIASQFISDSFNIIGDLKEGRYIAKEELIKNENIACVSSAISDMDLNLRGFSNERIKLEKVGVFFSLDRKVYVPNDIFLKLYSSKNVDTSINTIWISGEKLNVEGALEAVEQDLKTKNSENEMEVYSYIVENRDVEINALRIASLLISVIAIINSLSLSSLWVNARKFELSLRKALGATEKELCRLFLLELIVIAIISFISSIIIHLIIVVVTNGYIRNLDISINLKAYVLSIIFALGTTILVCLPSIQYISKINPVDTLKGE